MKITIIIPTCSSERIPLLLQTVESIQAGEYKDVHPVIVADGNKHIRDVANDKLHNVSVILNKERKDWIFSSNLILKEFTSEYYIYASDDLIFPTDCITKAMATMESKFPDGLGVVDLGRKDRGTFGLFGRKLADHFPNREVFCPDYVHYSGDTELCQAVKKMDKYAYPPDRESQVQHFRMNDETRILARSVRTSDHAIRKQREEKGYLWGVDFNLVTREGDGNEKI